MPAAERQLDHPSTDEPVGQTFQSDWEDWDFGPYRAHISLQDRLIHFWLMKQFDPTVRAALFIVKLMITRRMGEYRNDDNPKLQETVNELLGRMAGGPKRAMSVLLSALWAGFAVGGKVWQTEANEWWVDRLDLLHPMSFFSKQGTEPDGIKLDSETGTVTEVTQYSAALDQEPETIPIGDVVYWPLLQEIREQVYGNSLLEAARRGWFSKVKAEQGWNTFGEKVAFPTIIIRVPQGNITDSRTGETVSWAQYIAKFYEELEPGMLLAIPLDPDTKLEAELLSPQGDGKAFDLLCNYWDAQLFKSILTPRLLLEEPEHASRAQASTNLELFLLTLEGIRDDLGYAWFEQLVKPLIDYNAGPQDNYGEWVWQDLQQADLQMLAGVFDQVQRGLASSAQAAMAGGRELYDADEAKIREVYAAAGLASPAEVEEEQKERDREREAEEREAVEAARVAEEAEEGSPAEPSPAPEEEEEEA